MLGVVKTVDPNPQKRIDTFEALRGFLALWVVFIHIIGDSGVPFTAFGAWEFVINGVNAVDVFIMMSGFLIFRLLDLRQESYATFITRRFFRLFPAYLLCLCIAIPLVNPTLHALKAMPWQNGDVALDVLIFKSAKHSLLWHTLLHLTLLFGMVPHRILPASAYTLLGTAWSLSLEWQFYLIAPMIRSIVSHRNKFIAAATVLLTGILFIPFRGWEFMGFLPQKIPMFTLGILSFYAWKNSKMLPWMLLYAAGIFLFISKLPVVLWLIVFYACYFKWNFLEKPVLLYLGKISYSIYISHMIPLYLCMMLLLRCHINSQPLFIELMILLVVPLTVLISHFLYQYVEKPFIEYAKNIKTPVSLTQELAV